MVYNTNTFLIQTGLKSLGYDFGPNSTYGPIDGIMGPKTHAAILAFEADTATGPRTINAAGVALVKHFEGLYLKAYKCPAGIWTIGYGHTGLKHNDGTVHSGRSITAAQAEELLRHDLAQFEARVSKGAEVPLTDDQFSALVSFDFNTGGFLTSTLRAKLNKGDYAGAADEFLRWDKVDGRPLSGLTRRRKSERNLFLSITPHIVT